MDRYRRSLQLALGVIWLLDAALQYQPYMFTKAFPRDVLAPTGPGNPGWIAHPVHWAAHLTTEHVVWLNALFATVQLLIALAFFSRRTVRIALLASIVWALGIWWMGEGLGGLFVGPQSPVAGAPGAAVLYALLAILLWPRNEAQDATSSVATRSPLHAVAAHVVWLVLCGGFAFESLQAANRAPSALRDMVAGMADGESAWLGSVDHGFAGALAHHGTEVSIALAIGFSLVALSTLGPEGIVKSGLVLAIVISVAIWVIGENLGEIATGTATDPNTGPLLILLAAAYWPLGVRSELSAAAAAV